MSASGHADTVRDALTCPRYGDSDWHSGTCVFCERIEDALVAVAALEQAERDAVLYQHAFTDWKARAELEEDQKLTCAAARDQAERDRDEARAYAESQDWHTEWYAPMKARAVAAERDRDEARESAKKLNRRATQAEAVVMQTVEDCKRQGVSVGRALANSACNNLEARAVAAERRAADAEAFVQLIADRGCLFAGQPNCDCIRCQARAVLAGSQTTQEPA